MERLVNGVKLFNTEYEESYIEYDYLDECSGTIDSVSRYGAYLTLDNGEKAFSYDCACLPVGTQIICTVLKQAKEGKRKLVGFDSRVDEYELVG